MAISDKLTYLNDTKTQLKDMINYGLDTGEKITSETTFRNYVKSLFDAFIKTMTYPDVLYNNLPKVTGEGTSLTLNDTVYAPMRVELSPSALEQETSILPSEYTQVDYIESTGTQYIDTGVKLSSNHGFDIKFLTANSLATSNYGCILGGRNGSGNKDYQLTTYSITGYEGTLRLGTDYGDGRANAKITINTIQHCSLMNQLYIAPDNSQTQLSSTAGQSDYNCYLFGLNNGTSGFSQSGNGCRIYYCKLYDGSTLIRNFVPCYRNSDNEIGMYDLVNDEFYTNAGTGTFTKGSNSVLPTPDYPQEIHTVSGENSVVVSNANIWNEQWERGFYSRSTGEKGSGDRYLRCSDYIPIKPNTSIYFNKPSEYANYSVLFYDNTKRLIGNPTTYTASQSFTAPSTAYYFTFYLDAGSGITVNYNNDIMINYGTTATTYVPHQEQTYPISLGDLEYCKIGDYEDLFFKNVVGSDYYDSTLELDKWYLKKNIGKKQVLSTDTISYSQTANLFYDQDFNNLYNSDIIPICNYFMGSSSVANNNGANTKPNNTVCFRYGTTDRLYIIKRDTTVLQTLKDWLDTVNVYVYYGLATPTYTLLSDTLQTQLDNIQKAISYQDQTNVSQTNNDLPFVLSLSAIRDFSGIFELIQG